MNETIGAVGGHNDRIRRFRIKKRKELKKENAEEELKELEKSVKKSQKIIFIKAIPIVILGGALKNLLEVSTKKTTSGEDIEIKGNIEYKKDIKDINTPTEYDETNINIKPETKIKERQISHKNPNKITELKQKKESNKDGIIEITLKEESKDIDNSKVDDNTTNLDFSTLSPKSKERLEKLKSRKIIDEYDKKLKDIRYDLRRLVYDYNEIVDEDEKNIFLKESEDLLDRLTTVISKLDELKEKIKIEDLSKYDDNYIYTLIEDYLKEFSNGKYQSDIKDSPLYIMIAEKISELDTKSHKLDEHLKEKKSKQRKKENHLEDLKNKYLNFEKINYELLQFQNDQDILLKKVREKIANATSVTEKVEIEFSAMDYQSRKLISLMALSMFIPGRRSSKRLATQTASYLFFIHQLMHPPKTKKYRVINVKDYSRDINNNISEIEDANELLSKTSKQIDKVISEIKRDYSEYIDTLPECRSLLNNLVKMKDNINEKEYEMTRLKKDQELLLEENNAKVLTRGKYPMPK